MVVRGAVGASAAPRCGDAGVPVRRPQQFRARRAVQRRRRRRCWAARRCRHGRRQEAACNAADCALVPTGGGRCRVGKGRAFICNPHMATARPPMPRKAAANAVSRPPYKCWRMRRLIWHHARKRATRRIRIAVQGIVVRYGRDARPQAAARLATAAAAPAAAAGTGGAGGWGGGRGKARPGGQRRRQWKGGGGHSRRAVPQGAPGVLLGRPGRGSRRTRRTPLPPLPRNLPWQLVCRFVSLLTTQARPRVWLLHGLCTQAVAAVAGILFACSTLLHCAVQVVLAHGSVQPLPPPPPPTGSGSSAGWPLHGRAAAPTRGGSSCHRTRNP